MNNSFKKIIVESEFDKTAWAKWSFWSYVLQQETGEKG